MTKFELMEAKIERIVELEYDQLDKRLMRGEISQDEYDEEAKEINRWARDTYLEFELKGAF